jgi:hypothetical protein
MPLFKKKILDNQLVDVKTKLLLSLKEYQPEDPEYDQIIGSLERIDKLQTQSRWQVDPNVVAAGLLNLLLALVIIMYEQKHIWSSKAMSLIKGLR